MPKYRQNYTLFKRGKYYYYRTYTPDGVRTTAKTTGCTSLSAAKLYCDSLMKEGRLFVSSKTFADYASGFFDRNSVYARDNGLSDATISAYSTALKVSLIPLIGNRKIEDITHSYLKILRQKMMDLGQSASTVRLKMMILHIIIKSAYLDGLIARDPFIYLKELKEKPKKRDAFTLSEMQFLYSDVPDSMKGVILVLGLTGLRIAEFAALSASDILEEKGLKYIHLVKQSQRGKIQPLKNGKTRDIPISEKLVPYITEPCHNIKDLFRFRVNPSIKHIKDYRERLLSAHSLRHFFISSSKSYGINHLKVEAIAGHSLKGIQETYTTFKAADLADIIEWQEWAYSQITENGVKLNHEEIRNDSINDHDGMGRVRDLQEEI